MHTHLRLFTSTVVVHGKGLRLLIINSNITTNINIKFTTAVRPTAATATTTTTTTVIKTTTIIVDGSLNPSVSTHLSIFPAALKRYKALVD